MLVYDLNNPRPSSPGGGDFHLTCGIDLHPEGYICHVFGYLAEPELLYLTQRVLPLGSAGDGAFIETHREGDFIWSDHFVIRYETEQCWYFSVRLEVLHPYYERQTGLLLGEGHIGWRWPHTHTARISGGLRLQMHVQREVRAEHRKGGGHMDPNER